MRTKVPIGSVEDRGHYERRPKPQSLAMRRESSCRSPAIPAGETKELNNAEDRPLCLR